MAKGHYTGSIAHITLDPDVVVALRNAAKKDQRTVTGLLRKIISDWLKANSV